MKRLRVYVDTSVFGGCFDEEFAEESLALIEMAKAGKATLLISEVTVQELALAPDKVIALVESFDKGFVEEIQDCGEAISLRDRYLDESIVGSACAEDAHHVALATVARADIMVSWNFKHIVHFDKIRGFNAVNLREGYLALDIYSPKEVV